MSDQQLTAEAAPARTAHLLVVEDDKHLLQGICDILQLVDGYHVMTATNGHEGLKVLETHLPKPDLIISDIMMPRMDGNEFFNRVKANNEWRMIPFIFLTARGEKDDVLQGYRQGAHAYMIKPMAPEELLTRVENMLAIDQMHQDINNQAITTVKDNILTILNHEMRTPLTYVVAYADMLNADMEKMPHDEDTQTFLKGVYRGADRFRRLVTNFITLVELEMGEAEDNYAQRKQLISDIRSICTDAMLNTQIYAESRRVTVTMQAPDSVPAILGDHEYLVMMVSQLLENAIKFSGNPPTQPDAPSLQVELRVSYNDDYLHIAVQDRGRGIPEDEFDNIWLPFYQINRSEFEDQGAGSGLTIVRDIAKLHGGKTEMVSKMGEGSTFTILLPLAGSATDPAMGANSELMQGSEAESAEPDQENQATIESLIVLRIPNMQTLFTVRQDPDLQAYLVPRLDSEVLVVRPDQARALQQALAKKGITVTLPNGIG